MSSASISLKEVYFISMNPASSSVIFISPASTCTVLIFNQHRAQTAGAQMTAPPKVTYPSGSNPQGTFSMLKVELKPTV